MQEFINEQNSHTGVQTHNKIHTGTYKFTKYACPNTKKKRDPCREFVMDTISTPEFRKERRPCGDLELNKISRIYCLIR